VLSGEVLKAEKSRISYILDSSMDEKMSIPAHIWIGIRAKLHGRTVAEEQRKLDEKRIRLVDPVIEDVINFSFDDADLDATKALGQISSLLRRLDAVHSLYPTLKAFVADKPRAAKEDFKTRCDALYTWSKVVTSVRHQIAVLQHWTGSETLDVEQPNTTAEKPLLAQRSAARNQAGSQIADGTSFVERVLKEVRLLKSSFSAVLTCVIGIHAKDL